MKITIRRPRAGIICAFALQFACAALPALGGCNLFRQGSKVRDITSSAAPATYVTKPLKSNAFHSAKLTETGAQGIRFEIQPVDATDLLAELQFEVTLPGAPFQPTDRLNATVEIENASGKRTALATTALAPGNALTAKNKVIAGITSVRVAAGDVLVLTLDGFATLHLGAEIYYSSTVRPLQKSGASAQSVIAAFGPQPAVLDMASHIVTAATEPLTKRIPVEHEGLFLVTSSVGVANIGTWGDPAQGADCKVTHREVSVTDATVTAALPGAVPWPLVFSQAAPFAGFCSRKVQMIVESGRGDLSFAGMLGDLRAQQQVLMISHEVRVVAGSENGLAPRRAEAVTERSLAKPLILSGRYRGEPLRVTFPVSRRVGLQASAKARFFAGGGQSLASFDSSKVKARLLNAAGGVLVEFVPDYTSASDVSFAAQVLDYGAFAKDLTEDVTLEWDVGDLPQGTFLTLETYAHTYRNLVDPLPAETAAAFAQKERDEKNDRSVSDWDNASLTLYLESTKVTPRKLALWSVLQHMEGIRNRFHVSVNRGAALTTRNDVTAGTIGSCLQNNTAAHWSDLTMHYYCAHGLLRECYTNGIRDRGEGIQTVVASLGGPAALSAGDRACAGIALGNLRRSIYGICATPKGTMPPLQALPATCTGAWASLAPYVASDKGRTAFEWLIRPQGKDQFAGMFRYLMEAPTFGFDMQEQQDVINAFWRVKDPANLDECLAKRPRRQIDPLDGTHCLATKVHNPPLQPANR